MFDDLLNYKLNAIVRGAFSSAKFLKLIQERLLVAEIYRLALLETNFGEQFFFAPVGIDEGGNFEKKKNLLYHSITFFKDLGIEPVVSVLSGGRTTDIGRDDIVDETIDQAIKLVDYFQKESNSIQIFHDEILIENAIKRKSNLILAPDGISGNLIYRTLVHLGSGSAYGAVYLNLDKTIIDTSRVGSLKEIHGALILALALNK